MSIRALCMFTILFALCVAAEQGHKSTGASAISTLLDEAAKTSADEFLGLHADPDAEECVLEEHWQKDINIAGNNISPNDFEADSACACATLCRNLEEGAVAFSWVSMEYTKNTGYRKSCHCKHPSKLDWDDMVTSVGVISGSLTATKPPTYAPTIASAPEVASATITAADSHNHKADTSNRDSNMDIMNSCNNGSTFYRYRTGTSDLFTATLTLAQATSLSAVAITVKDPALETGNYWEKDRQHTAGYSGIRILVGGAEVYNSKYMYGTYDAGGTDLDSNQNTKTHYLDSLEDWQASCCWGKPQTHTFTSVQSNVQEVTIEFNQAYQRGDKCVSFNKIELIR